MYQVVRLQLFDDVLEGPRVIAHPAQHVRPNVDEDPLSGHLRHLESCGYLDHALDDLLRNPTQLWRLQPHVNDPIAMVSRAPAVANGQRNVPDVSEWKEARVSETTL